MAESPPRPLADFPRRALNRRSAMPPPLLTFAPNRVWRTYLGGRTLDALKTRAGSGPKDGAGPPGLRVGTLAASNASRPNPGVPEVLPHLPADSHFPEEWLASTTQAINPGDAARFPAANRKIPEGVSEAWTSTDDSGPIRFDDLLRAHAEYYLGPAHVARFGPVMQLLVKLLDPAIRLHLQVHPTAEFARARLGAPSGKTEAYHILAVRDDLPHAPYIYLGFQRPPTREALRDMILHQDIGALEKCFDRIPVNVGDTIFVPGGVPHALGAGVLLVEIMEPSDLVVRCEFTRGGYTIPESARFLGRDLEFCLDVFDYTEWPLRRVFAEAFCPPRRRCALGPDSWQDDLIGPERTPCFRVRQSTIHAPVTRAGGECWIGIITRGAATFRSAATTCELRNFEPCFVAAGAGPLTIEPHPTAQLLECLPPTA